MLTLSNRSQIQLSDKPLGQGGEGDVYEIKSPSRYTNHVAKKYKNPTSERERKLKYLIKNPPQTEENGHTFLIWPRDLLYENGKFVGFIMPKATGIELELLCSDDFLNYPEYQGSVWEKFAFSQPNSLIKRLKIARNICAAVAAVHAKNNYVLVDLKPQNIKITDKGLICIIDLDSIQVTEKGKVLFASKVATPEYSPPEVSQNPQTKDEYWDRFSLAVIIYRILVGIHPFTGTLKPPNDKKTTDAELIKEGFYPHGKKKNEFSYINEEHNRLFKYPDAVIKTFKKAFDDYLLQPDKRPSAADWYNALNPNVKPRVILFQSDKSIVHSPNENIKLTWKVEFADNIEIDNGVGDVTNRKECDVSIKKPTRFILTATNQNGTVRSNPIEIKTDEPVIKSFTSDRAGVIKGMSITLKWEIENADTIEIDNGIGVVTGKTEIEILPEKDVIYKITATKGAFKAESTVNIRVFPTPVLESLKVPMPDFVSRVDLNPIQIGSPKFDVSVNIDSLLSRKPVFTEPSIELKTLRPQYKPEIEVLNLGKIYERIRRKISRKIRG